MLDNQVHFEGDGHMPAQKISVATNKPIAAKPAKKVLAVSIQVNRAYAKPDYGDMLKLAVRGIKRNMQWDTYSHVLVDEFQDSSAAQTALLAAMAEKGIEVMVFGDADQAVYGFGGNHYNSLKNVMGGVVQMTMRSTQKSLQSLLCVTASFLN
jgi:DNA helicase-2/ATP-dependent DNA helicase PcrA